LIRNQIRVARDNARRNRVTQRIEFFAPGCARVAVAKFKPVQRRVRKPGFDFAASSTEQDLARLDRMGTGCRRDSEKRNFGAVRKAYEAAGLQLLESRTEKEWTSAMFQWKPQNLPKQIA